MSPRGYTIGILLTASDAYFAARSGRMCRRMLPATCRPCFSASAYSVSRSLREYVYPTLYKWSKEIPTTFVPAYAIAAFAINPPPNGTFPTSCLAIALQPKAPATTLATSDFCSRYPTRLSLAAASRNAIFNWFIVRKAVSDANSASAHGSSITLGMTSGSAVAKENSVFSLQVREIIREANGLRNGVNARARATPKSG